MICLTLGQFAAGFGAMIVGQVLGIYFTRWINKKRKTI